MHDMRKRPISLAAVLAIVAVMGCWILFVASFTLHELALGAGFTVFTTAVCLLAWHEMDVHFSPSPTQIALLWRVPGYILHDSVEVTLILVKDLLGIRHAGSLYRAVPFSPQPRKHGDAQLVLAVTGTTMTPSIIILGATKEHLLLHQLECSPIPQLIFDLEAQP